MNAIDIVRRLHQHRMWVNHQLLDVAETLTVDQFHQSFPIGQGSVWRTLTHLLAAEYVWLEALTGNEDPLLPGDVPAMLPGNQMGEGALESLKALTNAWNALDGRWTEYLSQLREVALDEIVYKISTSSGRGRRIGTKRIDVLLHVCTHAQYTTAQLVNMLRQLGRDELPDAMLITLAREEGVADT